MTTRLSWRNVQLHGQLHANVASFFSWRVNVLRFISFSLSCYLPLPFFPLPIHLSVYLPCILHLSTNAHFFFSVHFHTPFLVSSEPAILANRLSTSLDYWVFCPTRLVTSPPLTFSLSLILSPPLPPLLSPLSASVPSEQEQHSEEGP